MYTIYFDGKYGNLAFYVALRQVFVLFLMEISGPPEGARRGGGNRPPVASWALRASRVSRALRASRASLVGFTTILLLLLAPAGGQL